MTFISIGHSDRPIGEFLELLAGAQVGLVVDVRKLAGSRKFPHFNADALTDSLASNGVGYERIEALTGRRPRSHTVPPEVNALWRNQSFHNYADHALSDEFADGLARLRALGAEVGTNVAIMCAEAVWWRCHRRLIVDHLLAHGEQVGHVIGDPDPKPATLTPGARVAAGVVTYPAPDPDA